MHVLAAHIEDNLKVSVRLIRNNVYVIKGDAPEDLFPHGFTGLTSLKFLAVE